MNQGRKGRIKKQGALEARPGRCLLLQRALVRPSHGESWIVCHLLSNQRLFPEFAGFPCQFRGARLFVVQNQFLFQNHYGAILTDRKPDWLPAFWRK
jgi:hypothetical protein